MWPRIPQGVAVDGSGSSALTHAELSDLVPQVAHHIDPANTRAAAAAGLSR
jgi:hypothetical protein